MSRKKRRSRSGRRHRRDKSLRVLVIIAVLFVIAVFGAGYLKSRLADGSSRKKAAVSKEESKDTSVDKTEVSSEAALETDNGADAVKLGTSTVWKGKKYELRRKQDVVLFLGIDRSAEKSSEYKDAGQNGIAETLLVIKADGEKKESTLLEIPTDALVNLQLYDAAGKSDGTAGGPVGLQFSYGKSARDGCRLTSDRVSELLLGQTIDGTISLTSAGLENVVDDLGGVDITIPEDMTEMESIDPSFAAGQTVSMNGETALRFVTEGNGGTEAGRRQIAFLKALYHKSKSGENVAEFLNQAAENELYSGVDLDILVNLLACSVNEEVLELPGERTGEGSSSEFRTDEEKLMELLIGLFYEEAEERN